MAMRLGWFIAVAVSMSLVAASPAHADDSDDFLAKVSGQGINVGDTPTDVEIALATGEQVCHILHYGYTQQEAGMMVPYQFPNATPQQVAGFVAAAEATLCAQGFTDPVQPGGPY